MPRRSGEAAEAGGKGTAYSYTPDGKLATRTWARGVVTAYAYDASGSLTNIVYSDSTPDVAFQYDRLGRQKTITDVLGSRAFTYNDALQLAAETNVLAALARCYDALGRTYGYQVTAGSAAAQAVSYAYSDRGRFASLSSAAPSGSNTWNYSRLANSELISGWSNGIVGTVKCFESNRDLVTQVRHAAGGTMISQFDYENDELGRRTRRLDSGSAVATNLFAYDARSQLTNAVMKDNVFAWVLDPIGNRVSDTSNSVTHVYQANALNQYVQITNGGIRSLAYDWDGNLTNDSVFAYVWDCENRLVGVNGSGIEVAHKYDYMSRRVEKTANGVTNSFLYDGWNLVAETSSVGVTNFYVWGPDLSGTLQGAGGIGGLLAVIRNGQTYYPVADGNGNITDYVDADGTIVAHREFDAYGNTLIFSGPMVQDFNFWFSSKYLDREAGLYYYGYRHYSPELGRWMSRDPIGESGGRHLYAYVKNLAILQSDYLGLTEVTLHTYVQKDVKMMEAIVAVAEIENLTKGCEVNFIQYKEPTAGKMTLDVTPVLGTGGSDVYIPPLPPFYYDRSAKGYTQYSRSIVDAVNKVQGTNFNADTSVAFADRPSNIPDTTFYLLVVERCVCADKETATILASVVWTYKTGSKPPYAFLGAVPDEKIKDIKSAVNDKPIMRDNKTIKAPKGGPLIWTIPVTVTIM